MNREEKKAILEAVGINYDKGLERFMGNEALYDKFLGKFLYDSSYEEFELGVNGGDLAMAEKAVHTLKGTAGNLSMESLYRIADTTVKAIRSKKSTEEIQELADQVHDTYQQVCDAIRGM